jgi:hypothetical protein
MNTITRTLLFEMPARLAASALPPTDYVLEDQHEPDQDQRGERYPVIRVQHRHRGEHSGGDDHDLQHERRKRRHG